jgi:two-component system, LytTR family, response regulator
MKKYLEAIIVDDERLARNALKSLLVEIPEVRIVGEADNIKKTIRLVKTTNPDLIFLDIQLPGESGFELLDKIESDARIVFVTAYDEFALRAFEINALDYLLKPVSASRLRATIERLLLERKSDNRFSGQLSYDDNLFIILTNKHIFLKINTIVYISSSRDYTEIFLNDNRHGLTNKSMQEWEMRLPSRYFCRIHRSTIVNLNYILRIEEYFNNSFQVYLKGIEKPFTLSRRYAAAIRGYMG